MYQSYLNFIFVVSKRQWPYLLFRKFPEKCRLLRTITKQWQIGGSCTLEDDNQDERFVHCISPSITLIMILIFVWRISDVIASVWKMHLLLSVLWIAL